MKKYFFLFCLISSYTVQADMTETDEIILSLFANAVDNVGNMIAEPDNKVVAAKSVKNVLGCVAAAILQIVRDNKKAKRGLDLQRSVDKYLETMSKEGKAQLRKMIKQVKHELQTYENQENSSSGDF